MEGEAGASARRRGVCVLSEDVEKTNDGSFEDACPEPTMCAFPSPPELAAPRPQKVAAEEFLEP